MSVQQVVAASEALVKAHMAKYDPSHDWAHVERVRNTALRLARTLPGVDVVVVELAALFHDLADAKYSPTASLTSLLEPITSLPSFSAVSPAQLALVLRIVPAVSYSAETRLRAAGEWTGWHATCAELHAVQDADRLDAVGAVGVLRTAAYSGAKRRVLLEGTEEPGASCEAHFADKLLQVKGWMKTEAGRREAETRHQTMVAFLEALEAEKAMWAPI
ncbi:hypothetical protein Q5752_001137 [Cryptotrichosporon argae]